MPTKRILLTLSDIKELVAKKYKAEKESVKVFESKSLQYEEFPYGTYDLEDDSFLIQIDFEA